MTTIELKDAQKSIAEYAAKLRRAPLVFTRRGKPVAALVSLGQADRESLSLSLNPEFNEIIEKSRRRCRRKGTITSQEMRRRLGVKPPVL